MAISFNYGRLSSAQLDRWQAPTQRPIIDQRLVEKTAYRREIKGLVRMDINPSLQVLDKGIRQKSTKRVNLFIVCSAICPGPLNRDPHGPHGLQETTDRNRCRLTPFLVVLLQPTATHLDGHYRK